MIYFVTASDDNCSSYAGITWRTKRLYCEKYGHKYYSFEPLSIHEAVTDWLPPEWHVRLYTEYNPYWFLVESMLYMFHHMQEGDWLCLTGADSICLPNAPDCKELLDERFDLIVSKDRNGLNNSGMLLRNTDWGRTFLAEVWGKRGDPPGKKCPVWLPNPEHPNGRWHDWYEQGAIIQVLQQPEMEADTHVKYIPQTLMNAYPKELYGEIGNGNIADETIIVHLPNKTTEERVAYFSKVLEVSEESSVG